MIAAVDLDEAQRPADEVHCSTSRRVTAERR